MTEGQKMPEHDQSEVIGRPTTSTTRTDELGNERRETRDRWGGPDDRGSSGCDWGGGGGNPSLF